MIHEQELLLAAGAVLDDLDPDERAVYETHRRSCPDCRVAEVELDQVMADLALMSPERMPPPDLLAGIRLAIAAEDDAPRTISVVPSVPAAEPSAANVVPFRRPSRAPLIASLAIAAGLGVVALGLGARTVTLQQDLDTTSAQVASLEANLAGQGGAMTVALNPAHVTVALHGDAIAPDVEAAVVFVPGDDASYVVAQNLPATPSGHGYQLWYADAAGVHPLQTVSFDGSGTFVAPIGVDLADSTAVMITLEESGGAMDEPGPQVVFGEL
jgi:hypothetical protein